jgi:arylsulfatase A-like enzyme
VEWLEQRDRNRPFFLFLHYADPHDPYFSHPDMDCGEEPPGRFGGSREELRAMDAAAKRGELTDTDKARIRYLYACEVKYCDHWIGELVGALRRLDLWDDLLVVITADHGEGLWDHGERAHGRDLFDEMVHVPLIVKYPGRAQSARVQTPISLVDLAPTILAATGTSAPAGMQGGDLRTVGGGAARDAGRRGIYSELSLDWVDLESLRTGDYKLLRARKQTPENPDSYKLFDLRRDPGEQDDVAAKLTDTASALKESLQHWRAFIESPTSGSAKQDVALEDLSPAELNSLHALGYISDAEYQDAAQRRALGKPKDGG